MQESVGRRMLVMILQYWPRRDGEGSSRQLDRIRPSQDMDSHCFHRPCAASWKCLPRRDLKSAQGDADQPQETILHLLRHL